jgi:hypothetical protein
MESKKGHLGGGVFLIVVGILFLVGNISRAGMEVIWPAFILAVGLAFLVRYFLDRKNTGSLMPAAILIVIGLLFLYCTVFGWWHMEDLWPLFIMAPGVGFVAMYFGGQKDNGLLIPATILIALGMIFLFVNSGLRNFWPVLLILAGILIITFQFIPDKKGKGNPSG